MPNTVAVTPLAPRDRMVEAALAGLQASGLAGAGINQVVAASGAPKGSLYHYFPGGKSQLVREALARFGDRRIAALERVFSRDEPADQKVRRFFAGTARALEAEDCAHGCAVAGVALDLAAGDTELAAACVEQLDRWTDVIAAGLHPLPAARRAAWARFILSAFEGALVQLRARRSGQPMAEAGEFLARQLRAEIDAL